LEKANKNYDWVVFQNSPHVYSQYSTYMMRRSWDYFVKYLLGVEPPWEYQFKSGGRYQQPSVAKKWDDQMIIPFFHY
jgi:hypothetical protein